jgi:hypothetical protein
VRLVQLPAGGELLARFFFFVLSDVGGGESSCKHTKTIAPRCRSPFLERFRSVLGAFWERFGSVLGAFLERRHFLEGVYMLWVKSSSDFQH